MPEVLSVDEARAALLGAGLSDTALEAAIDEEEATLAAIIGPLTGERTETFPLAALRPLVSEVHLQRPTDTVELMVGDDTLTEGTDYELRWHGWRIARLPTATRYTGAVAATYTPTDELQVRRALKQLLGLTLSETAASGVMGETIDGYSYQLAPGTTTRRRRSIIRSLREPGYPGSTRLLSSVTHGLAGAVGR